ncbi:MAG: hypothetical protein IJ757_06105 [Clostridiales bacterium]|nr:hypothetical protein [Clostridiales bacterium]
MILRIGDKYDRIVDVMNNCFGWNYKACFKGWYQLNSYKKTSAWFPKIADLSNGKPEPGDKWYGWCNTLSDDGNTIYMNNYEDPSRLGKDMPDGIEPHITFIKLPHSDVYQYAGVFARKRRDKELGWVYERIAKDIDTRDYL